MPGYCNLSKLAQNTANKHVDGDASKQRLHGGRTTLEGVAVVGNNTMPGKDFSWRFPVPPLPMALVRSGLRELPK
jgi:hypothetical protein